MTFNGTREVLGYRPVYLRTDGLKAFCFARQDSDHPHNQKISKIVNDAKLFGYAPILPKERAHVWPSETVYDVWRHLPRYSAGPWVWIVVSSMNQDPKSLVFWEVKGVSEAFTEALWRIGRSWNVQIHTTARRDNKPRAAVFLTDKGVCTHWDSETKRFETRIIAAPVLPSDRQLTAEDISGIEATERAAYASIQLLVPEQYDED